MGCVDFRYIDDVAAPGGGARAPARRAARRGRAEREIVAAGYPAYTTSAGWLGYDDDKVEALVREARGRRLHPRQDEGRPPIWSGRPPGGADPRGARARGRADDGRQPGLGRRPGDRGDAALRVQTRGGSRSRRAPTTCSATRASAARSRRSASPPASTSRTASIFKQLFQAEAIDVCQIDACRLGGVNEVIAVLLLAAKFGVPVCPHAGGVGLCEYVQHLALFDYIAVSGSLEDRVVEWVDHLHEHFRDPAVVARRPLRRAARPGYSIEMMPESLDEYEFPDGPAWLADRVAGWRLPLPGTERAPAEAHETGPLLDRYRCCSSPPLLRAGPALILRPGGPRLGLTTPLFLTSQNIGNVLSQTAVIAILALGQLLVILTVASTSRSGRRSPSRPCRRGGLRATPGRAPRDRRDPRHRLAVGTINGLVFVFGRVPHPFIVTLATLSVARGLALCLRRDAVPGMPPIVQVASAGLIDWLPYSTFVVAGAGGARPGADRAMVWGRWIYAVGGNPEAARRAGMPQRVLVSVYMMSGLRPGSAGC